MPRDRTAQTIYIKPRSSWLDLDLSGIWAYRELLYFLTWRDVKVRYRQTAIGIFWAILQPGLTTLIFTVVFSRVANFDSPGLPYPLLVLSGLLVWLYVNSAVIFSANSIVTNSPLVTKVYFPRLLMPMAPVIAGLIELVIGFLILLGVMLFYGTEFKASILVAPLFMLMAVVLTIAAGTFTSALNVRFRDIKFVLPFGLQIWMFASPIFYPMEILSDNARTLLAFNPMTGILSGFRSALFGLPFDWWVIGMSAAVTAVALIVSLMTFRYLEDDFADII